MEETLLFDMDFLFKAVKIFFVIVQVQEKVSNEIFTKKNSFKKFIYNNKFFILKSIIKIMFICFN